MRFRQRLHGSFAEGRGSLFKAISEAPGVAFAADIFLIFLFRNCTYPPNPENRFSLPLKQKTPNPERV